MGGEASGQPAPHPRSEDAPQMGVVLDDGRHYPSERSRDEDRRFQDFVIAHELLHIRVPNHGRLFKALMSVHVPEWRRFNSRRA